MGFAYQAFPRFKHTSLALPPLAWTSLGLMLAGLLGRSVAEPLAETLLWAGPVAIMSTWLEVIAISLFAAVVLATWKASGKGLAFYDGYILAALGWFVLQAVAEALYLRATLAAGSQEELVDLVATWQGALRDVQIHGFALLMILGVSQRMLHNFYGFPAPNVRLSLAVLACLNLGVAGEATGLVLMRSAGHAWAGLWYASTVLLTGSVLTLAWNWRIFGPAAEPDRSLKFVRAAYAWLLISLGMLLALPVYQFLVLPWLAPEGAATHLGFSHAYYGAVRHSITVGFISLMIVGVAARIVPTLNGVEISRLSALWAPFALLNGGCAMRVVAQTCTDFTPRGFPAAGVSGVLEVTGLALWGIHLWSIMAGRSRLQSVALRAEKTYQPGSPITAEHRVGALLDAHPELFETFVRLGFRPLANPLLRRTLARGVSVGGACRQLGVDTAEVLAELNRVVAGPPLPDTGPGCCKECHC
jgi:hypothetical protein